MSQGFVTGPSEAAGTAIGGVGSNTYTIDGATNAGVNRQLSTSPNADMIQEMRVETSNFDAGDGPRARQPDLHDDARRHEHDARHAQLSDTGRTTSTRSTRSRRRRSTTWRGNAFEDGRSHNSAVTLGGPVVHSARHRRPQQDVLLRELFLRQRLDSGKEPRHEHGSGQSEATAGRLLGHAAVAQSGPVHHLRSADGAPRSGQSQPDHSRRRFRTTSFRATGSSIRTARTRTRCSGSTRRPCPAPNQNFLSPTQQPTGNYFRGAEPSVPVSHLLRLPSRLQPLDVQSVLLPRQRQQVSRGRRRLDVRIADTAASAACTTAIATATPGPTPATGRTRPGQTVFDTQVSTNRFYTLDKQLALSKYKPSDFGLPGYMDQFCESKGGCLMPRVNIDGYQALSRGVNPNGDMTTNLQGQVNLTQVRGSHTMRSGHRYPEGHAVPRRLAATARAPSTSRATTRGRPATNPSSTASDLGLSLAAFMLGVPTSVQMDDQMSANFCNHFIWRVRPGHVARRPESDDQRRPAFRVQGRHSRDRRSDARRLRSERAHVDLSGGRSRLSGERRSEHARHATEHHRTRRLGLRHRFGAGRRDVAGTGDVDAAVVGCL